MDIVFFGSSQFAAFSSEALLTTKHKISCVVTQPDRPSGRRLALEGTAIKKIAKRFNLKIYQPQQINAKESIKILKSLNPDLFVVIAYGQILSQQILNIPKIFSINVHASLLPKYRGAAPISWAIIKGEENTGVTIMKMSEKMDAGEIIAQETVNISQVDTSITLENKLSQIAADLLLKALDSIENNNYKVTPQDETKVSLAPKLKKKDGLIDWKSQAQEINNLIRGCFSWPGAFTYYQGKLLKIFKAEVLPISAHPVIPSPGEIIRISLDGIIVAAGKDSLWIKELQLEGKRKMTAREFIAGHKISIGESLNKK